MAKSDLPAEVDRRRLNYREPLSTLEQADGKPVVVMLPRSAADHWPLGTATFLVADLDQPGRPDQRSPSRHTIFDELVIATTFEDLHSARVRRA